MRGIIFETWEDAAAELARRDSAAGLPRNHTEGGGPDDYQIGRTGNAALRLRRRGVRTEHVAPIYRHPVDGRAAVGLDGSSAVDLDDTWRSAAPSRASP